MSTRQVSPRTSAGCRDARRELDSGLSALIAEAVRAALTAVNLDVATARDLTTVAHKERLIRLPEVLDRTGLKRSTIYNRIAVNEFPAQLNLGGNVVAWRESEIDAWIFSASRRDQNE